MKTLIIRMSGFGDVAAILIPAVKLIRYQQPQSSIDVLTYSAGNELMALVPGVDSILAITPEQWPNDLHRAVQSFMDIAETVISKQYDQIINLDTWFMPCFLARILKDLGVELKGNYINLSIDDFFRKLNTNQLTQKYFNSTDFLDSSFPNMHDWTIPWWDKYPDAGSYPEFYLHHCCGFDGHIDISLAIDLDFNFKLQAGGQKIIALSMSGSKASKQYKFVRQLKALLEDAGYFVWSQFDGSAALQITLGRLKASNLLITVPTSTQWLAKLVGCPSLLIPGPLPPSVLGAELVVDRMTDCQYCFQNHCPINLNFDCMDTPPERILTQVSAYFSTPAKHSDEPTSHN